MERTISHSNGQDDSDVAGYARVDLRTLLPVTGLKEYWYPGVLAKDVKKKPILLRILDKEVCLFQGKSGIAAVDNACVHRGGMLHTGDCWWPGTISCFYHGWTYDENGEVLAVLSEGPDCKIPGQVKLRVYPTRTLQGVVWIWMGDGVPAPIEEDVPREFFDEKAMVLTSVTEWDQCNWRQSLENNADSHPGYLHRNSFRRGIYPIPHGRTRIPRPEVFEGRTLNRRRDPAAPQSNRYAGVPKPYQRVYPLLGAKWPRSRWRLSWTWFFDLLNKRVPKQTLRYDDPEWGAGSQHLPGMVRNYHHGYYYTRQVVAVGANKTRLFYFHSSKPSNALGRLLGRIMYYGWGNWLQNYNFSGQDGAANTFLYYDQPEYLSATDAQTVEWRRLILHARGMNGASSTQPNGVEAVPDTKISVKS